jgi:hypothetical protein
MSEDCPNLLFLDQNILVQGTPLNQWSLKYLSSKLITLSGQVLLIYWPNIFQSLFHLSGDLTEWNVLCQSN